MSDTLYLLLDKNIQTLHPHIYLQDIASLSCSNSKLLNRLRVMPVVNLPPDKPGRYVLSVMDLISKIQQKEPDLEITPIGEPTFIITYKNKPGPGLLWEWIKILFVGLSTFFGAAFSIMTFNNDVDVGKLFASIYTRSPAGFLIILQSLRLPTPLVSDWEFCFSLIISDIGNLLLIPLPCRYRCVSMKIM